MTDDNESRMDRARSAAARAGQASRSAARQTAEASRSAAERTSRAARTAAESDAAKKAAAGAKRAGHATIKAGDVMREAAIEEAKKSAEKEREQIEERQQRQPTELNDERGIDFFNLDVPGFGSEETEFEGETAYPTFGSVDDDLEADDTDVGFSDPPEDDMGWLRW